MSDLIDRPRSEVPDDQRSPKDPRGDDRLARMEERLDEETTRRNGVGLLGVGLGAIALFVAVIGVGFGMRAIDGDGEGGGAAAAGGTETFEIELGELYVEPSSIEVAAGTEVIVVVTNAGTMDHDLKLLGETGTAMIPPGGTEEVSLGVIGETTQAWCTVPGHKEGGMLLDIEVTGAAAGHTEHDASAAPAGTATGAEIDFAAEPAADFVPYDPTLAPAPGGTEHEITLRADEVEIEVAPGVTQQMWTFEDTVPGPTLRGKVGDIFTVTLINEGEVGHSLDFHASKVAWDDEMRTIAPGESLVYQFEAKHAGVWMYHCGTSPALHHIGNGMFGAIIIDPPELAPVDHEYVLVQSEIYTGPQGEPGDLAKMQDEAWDAIVFNGYVNQYQHRPIRVEPGERVRLYVVDAGPNENSAFHIVGTIFDTVFREGTYVLQPDGRQGGSQVLDLQPAQGGFVEFSFDEAGFYPIVTHKFANAGKGAMGFFQAGDAEPPAGGH